MTGCVLGIPAGVVLTYLAMLPAFLGLFFYLLFGLLIGAVMVRIGRRAAPVPKRTLWRLGGLVAILIWGTSLVTEDWLLPRSATKCVRDSFSMRHFTPDDWQLLRDKTSEHVASYLRDHYSPGGLLGYVRWAVTDGAIDCPRLLGDGTQTFRLPQRRIPWLIRQILGFTFILWMVMAQTLELAGPGSRPSDQTAQDETDAGGPSENDTSAPS